MFSDDARVELAEAIAVFDSDIRPATREALIDAAVAALVAGHDSRALAELAGRDPDAPWSELRQTAHDVVRELDLQLPTTEQIDLRRLRRQLEAMLAGRLGPREMTSWAHMEFGHEGIAEAQAFVNADDEYDVVEYGAWTTALLDEQIESRARALVQPLTAGDGTERFVVDVQRDGTTTAWELLVREHHNDSLYILQLTSPDGDGWQVEYSDEWNALRILRALVEPTGARLCCNGARVDVHTSEMNISMSAGRLAYRLRTWRQSRFRRDLIDIFAPAPPNKIGSLAEQDAYFERWRRRWWMRPL